MAEEIDLRAALNAVSDVIQNRPRPLREFDQIYMKAGDMVLPKRATISGASRASSSVPGPEAFQRRRGHLYGRRPP